MNLTYEQNEKLLPISKHLIALLNLQLTENKVDPEQEQSIIFNFRDPDYSAENGGYHPVEIRLIKRGANWHFDYITDFCFVGGAYPELVKEIDWLVMENKCYHNVMGELNLNGSREFFALWEGNFISYANSGVFEVTITT